MSTTRFMRGARPTPRHKLLAATPHRVVTAPPTQFCYVPKQLDMWGNDTYGDCVSAEEAFAKACFSPEIFIPSATVVAWAGQHGWLNGADLTEVMDQMIKSGFPGTGNQLYDDGPYTAVDYSNETVLQSAISQGPVKIAIDANALPSGAGNSQGWYATGQGSFPNTDHCVSVCGYGPADWLYQQLGVPLPSALAGKTGYLVYTWKTIGFVDHPWLMGTCVEAWVRNPTTVGVPPLTPPAPTLQIFGVTPNSGPIGTTITITGTGFTSVSQVVVGNQTVNAALSSQGLNCNIPAGASGSVSVSVTQSGQTVTLPSAFLVTGPTPPPPPPVPGGVVVIPAQTVTATITIPAQTVPVTTSTASDRMDYIKHITLALTYKDQGLTLPPWLITALQAMCAEAPLLPAPWNSIAMVACSLLPPPASECHGCK